MAEKREKDWTISQDDGLCDGKTCRRLERRYANEMKKTFMYLQKKKKKNHPSYLYLMEITF